MLRYLTTETQRHRGFIWHKENSVSLWCIYTKLFFIQLSQAMETMRSQPRRGVTMVASHFNGW